MLRIVLSESWQVASTAKFADGQFQPISVAVPFSRGAPERGKTHVKMYSEDQFLLRFEKIGT
jgi:hypothetical protein